jgi:imidazolonepropionase-like amidohydrolase
VTSPDFMRIGVSGYWTPGLEASGGPAVLHIKDGIIQEIAPDEADGNNDLNVPFFALPGLVDAHEHVSGDVGDEHAQALSPREMTFLRVARNLAVVLARGVTTVRDVGEITSDGHLWIAALRDHVISGPRVVRSVRFITRSGGHAWYAGHQADGAEGVRRAVRQQVRAGAQFIKFMATGGLSTSGSVPTGSEFTRDEVEALVDEAHRLGRKVAAHAHGGSGADYAIDAGVDSIEHGSSLTHDQLERMADKGTYLVATLGCIVAYAESEDVPLDIREKMAGVIDTYLATMSLARECGVNLAVGTDAVHGRLDWEVALLQSAGYTRREALTAATLGGAAVIGDSGIGELRPGAAADVIFVDGDPLREDGSVLCPPRRVLFGGRWVAEDGHLVPGLTPTPGDLPAVGESSSVGMAPSA